MTARSLNNTGYVPFLTHAVQFSLAQYEFSEFYYLYIGTTTKTKAIYLRDKARNRTSNYLNTEAPRLKH